MRDFFYPTTDQAVFIQWAAAAGIWLVIAFAARKAPKEYRTLLLGIFMVNAAFFATRALH